MSETNGRPNEEGTLRVVVVDDEEPARLLLRELLGEIGGVEVVAECANGHEAVRTLGESEVDLVLLDVQMPEIDGFEVLELLGDEAPAVIFVTAYDDYALRAFEVHAVDYVLKPVEEERLDEAVNRARERIEADRRPESESPAPDVELLRREIRRARREPAHLERILVRDGSDIHVVAAEDLDYVEAQGDYVMLEAGERSLRKPERLSHLADALDPGRFVRIHRSYVLNVDRLEKLELYAKDSRVAILHDGRRLPVSRSGYKRLRERL